MKEVFLLWHSFPEWEDEHSKLLGVYSSREIAQQKIDEFYLKLVGFDEPEGEFCISKYKIDKMEWSEGFVWVEPEKKDE